MKSYAITANFKYPEIKPEHRQYVFGASNAGEIIRENGDWRDFIPEFEAQRRHGVESSACYIEAQQKAICTIQEEEFGIVDSNYSARFNALLSDGSPDGGDPLVGADSIRNDGLIVEDMMRFSDDILSWNDYHSWKGADEHACRLAGKQFLKKWKLNNYIVFERDEDVNVKYAKLKEALKRSPTPMSFYGWVEKDGVFIKPQGTGDNHLALCLYVDKQNRPHILDTYPPYIKIGEPFYNSDFAMRYTVKEIPQEEKKTFFEALLEIIKKICTLLFK